MSKTQSEIAADLATDAKLLREEFEAAGNFMDARDVRMVRLAQALERLCEVTAMLAARVGA